MAPLTANNGGNSKSDPNAGADPSGPSNKVEPIKTSDRAGAGILTVLVIFAIIGGGIWLML